MILLRRLSASTKEGSFKPGVAAAAVAASMAVVTASTAVTVDEGEDAATRDTTNGDTAVATEGTDALVKTTAIAVEAAEKAAILGVVTPTVSG